MKSIYMANSLHCSGICIYKQGQLCGIKLMKDSTRGGIATALNEMMETADLSVHITENSLPAKPEVAAAARMLGLDPLYHACEDRMLLAVDQAAADNVLSIIHWQNGCEKASIIGSFENAGVTNKIFLETAIGAKRIIEPLTDEMLPRIS